MTWPLAHEERQSDCESPVVCVAQHEEGAPTSWVQTVESLHERKLLGAAHADVPATQVALPPVPKKGTQQPSPLLQRVLPQATPSGSCAGGEPESASEEPPS